MSALLLHHCSSTWHLNTTQDSTPIQYTHKFKGNILEDQSGVGRQNSSTCESSTWHKHIQSPSAEAWRTFVACPTSVNAPQPPSNRQQSKVVLLLYMYVTQVGGEQWSITWPSEAQSHSNFDSMRNAR
eukprot:m.27429 g.27429  ORF g.27429 m.27429 type:complete len:128 (-) comp8934_c0_seq3:32-415(-)